MRGLIRCAFLVSLGCAQTTSSPDPGATLDTVIPPCSTSPKLTCTATMPMVLAEFHDGVGMFMLVDEGYVYADVGDRMVRVPKNGGTPETIVPSVQLWASRFPASIFAFGPEGTMAWLDRHSLVRGCRSGANVRGAGDPSGPFDAIAFGGDTIYTTGYGMFRNDGADTTAIPGYAQSGPVGKLTVEESTIYFLGNDERLYAMPASGGSAKRIALNVSDFEVAGSTLYVASVYPDGWSISEAKNGGMGVARVVASGDNSAEGPWNIVVAGDHIYGLVAWTRLVGVPVSGGTLTTLIAEPGWRLTDIVADDRCIYWTAFLEVPSMGTVHRIWTAPR